MVHFAYYDDNWKQHIPDNKSQSPDDEYWNLTYQLVALTGHEQAFEEAGGLKPRAEREANYRKAVGVVNRNLKLGFDETDVEILTLVYTALSEVTRFGGNEHIAPEKAENTGTHSIHTPLWANLIIRRALERLGQEENRESVVMRQLAGMCLLPHDLGESLGEPGSLAQESKIAGFQKDKPAAEKLIANAILRLAAHAVERGDYRLFYQRLDEMKIPDIETTAPAQSNEEFLAQVKEKLGVPPQIGVENEGRVATFMDFWVMQEHAGHVPARFQGETSIHEDFLSAFSSFSEHQQGEGHILVFLQKQDEPERGLVSWSKVNSFRQMKNLKYNEGEVGDLFAAAKTPLEKAIAVEAKREAYAKSIEFLREGAAAVNREAAMDSELPADNLGREAEIAELARRSAAEGQMQQFTGTGQAIRTVETKERLIAMYEWARDNDDFIPKPGQILIYDPPEPFLEPEREAGAFAGKVAQSRAQEARRAI